MAPTMLPIPPSTAAVKALMPGMKPMAKKTWLKMQDVQDAGRAGQQAADGEGARRSSRSTLMPIIAAASLSSDTARIARPVRVRLTNT